LRQLGLNIAPHHAVLTHARGRVLLRPVAGGRTFVNGRLLEVRPLFDHFLTAF
jgi:hypothetical protein